MSMNRFMHPRNLYKTPPNFKELAIKYPEFREYARNNLDGSVCFDFKNSHALRCLNTILLKKDFNLDVFIPPDNLVPTLPLRLNYILWLEDVLEWKAGTDSLIKGIDIGTGATCIFPLLAAKNNGWKMIGTEINETSVNIAVENIRRNSLDHLISIKTVPDTVFLDGVFDKMETFDFCMCNPPFFSSEQDVDSTQKSRTANRKEPNNCRTGVSDEIISPGGEVEFIRNIIRDSLKLRERIKIYTTMMGHKSSLEILIKDLQSHGLTYSQTMFCQGHTIRWALAWTFCSIELKDYLPDTHKKVKPITWTIDSKYNFKGCVERIPNLLTDLNIPFKEIESFKKRAMWKITAHENTWSGSRRRRRERQRINKILNSADNTKPESSMETSDTSVDVSKTSESSNNDHQMDVDDDKIERNSASKRSLEEDDDSPVKKIKTEDENTKEPIVEAVLNLYSSKDSNVDLQMAYVSGSKEALHQLMTYLKNNLV
ncbi:U6 small nuclear RNA (adenine-(43)-N(6))-methyltransferase [Planococcus citri]|uniref:U6 small nuclear RNA (adenine-(43)-N(6))-methyltransferase n=1 Tax=Planococcus citri TaxID=170843 RepID=UPI0031FA098A